MKRLPLLALLTFFLVLPLALRAETPPDFAKWEKAIAAFEAADRANPPAKGALLFVGASGIVRWKTLAEDFPQQRVLNRAFGGSQIAESTHFAERIIFPYEPRMILLRAGGNDIHAGKSAERVFADFKNFVAKIRTKYPEIPIVFISISPSASRWAEAATAKAANALIAAYIRETPHLQYVETYDMVLGADGKPRPELFVEDQLHFTPAAYKLLAERVRPVLPK
jgi:lysophospholipase L1-like esterase